MVSLVLRLAEILSSPGRCSSEEGSFIGSSSFGLVRPGRYQAPWYRHYVIEGAFLKTHALMTLLLLTISVSASGQTFDFERTEAAWQADPVFATQPVNAQDVKTG